ncbi:MAG: lysophospholipid acyltransferase family protein [Cytophagales bacterium]
MKLRDPFGNFYFIKAILVFLVGWMSWPGFDLVNKLNYKGLQNLKGLPKKGVLFVSNHQTYYADVVAINHGFHKARGNKDKKRMGIPFYLFWPIVRTYYVAAKETMTESGFLPKVFSYGGGILVKRTWREKGKEISRNVDMSDQNKIAKALSGGWIVTFPQGTTKPYSPLRKGTAHIIKDNNPIVVPVTVDGFRRGFNKKGLFFKKKGIELKVEYKEPIRFEEHETPENILAKIAREIGQDHVPLSIVLKEGDDYQKS